MSFTLLGRSTSVAAAALAGVGIYLDSELITLFAILLAATSAYAWIAWSRPHDHWRDFRR